MKAECGFHVSGDRVVGTEVGIPTLALPELNLRCTGTIQCNTSRCPIVKERSAQEYGFGANIMHLAMKPRGWTVLPRENVQTGTRTGPRREPWNRQGTVHSRGELSLERSHREVQGNQEQCHRCHVIKKYIT